MWPRREAQCLGRYVDIGRKDVTKDAMRSDEARTIAMMDEAIGAGTLGWLEHGETICEVD